MPSARMFHDLDERAMASHERVADRASDCADDEAWVLLVEGALATERVLAIRRHAERCESCHLTLAGLGLASEAALVTTDATNGTSTAARRGRGEGQVGRYVVLDTLGEGGMGIVYKAYDPELDRQIALKLLKASASAGRDELVNRLQREARSMAKLSHPNVVSVYDVGKHEGGLYVAMELVHGETLDAYVGRAKPPLSEIVRCFRDVARGLSAAHDSKLVHRDLKPQNVLVSHDRNVKVTDFGLARPEGSSANASEDEMGGDALACTTTAITRTGQIVGTPAYMAPEQFAGTKTDVRTDVFSFGVALYEAVFGVRPFPGTSVAELRANVLAGRRRSAPVSALGVRDDALGARGARDDALGAVSTRLERCLAVDPSHRPSMREMEEALETLRARLVSSSTNDPPRSRLVRTLAIGVALTAMAIALVGLGVTWRKGEEALSRTSASASSAPSMVSPRPSMSAPIEVAAPRPVSSVSADDAGSPPTVATTAPSISLSSKRGSARRPAVGVASSPSSHADTVAKPELMPNGAPILH